MSTTTRGAGPRPDTGGRRPGELTVRELLRWGWRQLTSMRTALVLLLLLALAAVPGSIVPQEGVDSLATSQWKDDHPTLTPVYEALGLFDVYDAPWFSAIYLLLMVSLVGCIVPRTFVYLRAVRAAPPRAPRNLARMPDSASYTTDEDVDAVLARARTVLRRRRYRVRPADLDGTGAEAAVSSEKGYLREVGNLVFHLSVLVVLVGFGLGGLFGYTGGVLLTVGTGFSNGLTQYDDFVPGSLFDETDMEPFSFRVEDFDVDWRRLDDGSMMAQKFSADVRYQESLDAEERSYDLRVNHPLSIGDTEVFLIGHGYAPVVTIRDGEGNVAASGPTIFLPQDQTLLSFGVIKAPDAKPGQVGLEGLFFPTWVQVGDDPFNVRGDLKNPLLSLSAYTGDLNLDSGEPQSVYVLDKSGAEQVMETGDKPLRLDLQVGDTVQLPDGLGSVTFEGIEEWNRLQISRTPGKHVALAGVVLALLGLLGSLFVRPRRVWVRARREGGATLVEVAALDRSGGGTVAEEIERVVAALNNRSNRSKEDS